MKTIEFWFEFASTYSYLSAMRVGAAAREAGVVVTWRPFLLGPIFRGAGWETSPFNVYPAKGAYMWRDVERRAARLGLAFRRLDREPGVPFPQNGLAAARLALVGLEAGWGQDFCREVYAAEFAEARDISDRGLLEGLARAAGAEEADLASAGSDRIKSALRAQTERAAALGLFGAPSFTAAGELFWGDDRLEDALAFAAA